MKVLYIYPHPDDESFGPGRAMFRHRRGGHEVYLLTLTKGGATRRRHKFGYSVEEMGEVRYKEMLEVEKTLDLSGMSVLDLPDSGLKEMDPREIEAVVAWEIRRLEPDVVVTYPVHGISGFHDHLVSHAVVKRVFLELQDTVPSLKRLAFLTITEAEAAKSPHFHLNGTAEADIDCVMPVEAEDIEANHKALDCYVTFKETIEKTNIKDFLNAEVVYEFYNEDHDPPLTNLFKGL